MMRSLRHFMPLLLALTFTASTTAVRPAHAELEAIASTDPAPLIEEHVYGGVPMHDGTLYVRQGYVLAFDDERRVPAWTAYHLTPDYLDTPPREGRFSSFRVDPDAETAPRSAEYTRSGYDRGHLAPYFAMGGDRDGDGAQAADGDEHDALTVIQGNYMANIAPHYPQGFNRAPNLWWTIETWIRNVLVREHGHEAWVFAGSIHGPKRYRTIGPDRDIEVPPMFFMLVIIETEDEGLPVALAYLLPHQQQRHGAPEDFLVSVRLLEAMTGLSFFEELAAEHGEGAVSQWKAESSLARWPIFESSP